MNDSNRRFDQTATRVNQKVGEAADRLEKQASEFIKYLNDEVVPAVRQGSTKALRKAADKLHELANYMEQQSMGHK